MLQTRGVITNPRRATPDTMQRTLHDPEALNSHNEGAIKGRPRTSPQAAPECPTAPLRLRRGQPRPSAAASNGSSDTDRTCRAGPCPRRA